ncbi:SGNH/GDSL hydrolase family protein [Shimia sp. CNT1-13L.2]|uniref:SGNH/GDSL hydrolase family protein n=1 Tax=Shimia sp. CNT1-13L.2 TaxID=2959663 RepID=UPI0020CDCE5C|nr:SGNH/GDSL hydrolase family protein [Shimia sp. CNT1-13L.2]MCP9480882.1 SGNH/GDSL hydrolase family protein [Shimia sp. CNT1-13L.2]
MAIAPDQVARVLLLPVLVAQGVWLGVRAMRLPEPPGPRAGMVGKGPALRLLILGDSSAAGVGAMSQDTALSGQLTRVLAEHVHLDWHLEGETSATTKTSLAKLNRLPDQEFDIAILIHGVNDTTRFTPRKKFHARQSALIKALCDRHGIRHFVLSGVPPLRHFSLLPHPLRWVLGKHADRLDTVLADIARTDDGVTHLQLTLPYEPRFTAIDGFHPSEAAYAVWAGMLADLVLDQAGRRS